MMDLLQIQVPPSVRGLPLVLIVLRVVQLNGQSGRMTVKIHNIGSEYHLTAEGERKGTKKLIPQLLLLFCGVFSELPGILPHPWEHIHTPLIRPSGHTGAPSPLWGEGFSFLLR